MPEEQSGEELKKTKKSIEEQHEKEELALAPAKQDLEQFLKGRDNETDLTKFGIIREIANQGFTTNMLSKLESQEESGFGGQETRKRIDALSKEHQKNEELATQKRKDPYIDTIYTQAEGLFEIYHNGVRRTQTYTNERDSRMRAASLLLTHSSSLK